METQRGQIKETRSRKETFFRKRGQFGEGSYLWNTRLIEGQKRQNLSLKKISRDFQAGIWVMRPEEMKGFTAKWSAQRHWARGVKHRDKNRFKRGNKSKNTALVWGRPKSRGRKEGRRALHITKIMRKKNLFPWIDRPARAGGQVWGKVKKASAPRQKEKGKVGIRFKNVVPRVYGRGWHRVPRVERRSCSKGSTERRGKMLKTTAVGVTKVKREMTRGQAHSSL